MNNLVPIDFLKNEKRRTRSTTDRDPQQGGGGGDSPKHHHFTDQELDEALKYLRELPGIKENNLQFRIERNEKRIVIFVEDVTGKVISRIPDVALWSMLQSRQSTTRGNLLNKSL